MEKYSDYVPQESFTVVTENRSQSAVMFRNRAQSRHALLYEHQLVFCRAVPGGDTGGEFSHYSAEEASRLRPKVCLHISLLKHMAERIFHKQITHQ